MNEHAPVARSLRRASSSRPSTIVSIALVSTAASDTTAVVAIIHPMQPIGNIDCCH